ncbi:hypothetical protein [Lewinella sp. JB7]|uniref:hypothetical protein n=1 Tax=Lewinella sp. JB7 TaxID=2962887 RepID=UPI0020C95D9D|nr:hypothetical protein [Lewinella sp. JB7]MCP9236167.1 hypothetical protein [Lewinella sp. JB7]
MKFSSLFSTLLLALLITACSKDDAPTTGFQLRMELDKSTVNYRSAGDLRFTSGSVVISEIEFDGDRADGTSVSLSQESIMTFDLATGLPGSGSVAVQIPAGEYRSVYLGIELLDDGDKPTLVAEGTYGKEDGTVYPVRFEFNSGEVFEAEADGTTVEPGTIATSKIVLNPHHWFAGITRSDLEDATVNGSGVILISEESNTDIFDRVADGLDLATEAVFR